MINILKEQVALSLAFIELIYWQDLAQEAHNSGAHYTLCNGPRVHFFVIIAQDEWLKLEPGKNAVQMIYKGAYELLSELEESPSECQRSMQISENIATTTTTLTTKEFLQPQ